MQIVFDRYEPLGGAVHQDLASGERVEIAVRDVEDEAWRRQWRANLIGLADGGEIGTDRVFEVRRTATARVRGRASRAAALAYLEDEGYDTRTGLVRCSLDADAALWFAREAGRVAISGDIDPHVVPRETRVRGFVILGDSHRSRAAWSAALAAASSRRHYYVPLRVRSASVRERAPAYLAAPAAAAAPCTREWQRANVQICRARDALARGRLSAAVRFASRALMLSKGSDQLTSEACALKGRAIRLQGGAVDACDLLIAALDERSAAAIPVLLIEAAEAAIDCVRLERGEAFARAALHAATTADGQHRAMLALDRARVWRGETVETEFWSRRAAWHRWGTTPIWPARGGYAHAPAGPLARWEWMCDGLERSIWSGNGRAIARDRRRLLALCARLPPLLRARVDWLAAGVPRAARRLGAAGILQTGRAGVVMEVFERMSDLLRACQDADGEHALGTAAARLREALRARAVAIHVSGSALPVAGDGAGWNAASDLAERCSLVLQTAGPEPARTGRQMATSIRNGGAPAGAIAATWPADGPIDQRQARLLLESAALMIGPVVRSWRLDAETPRHDDMPEIVGGSAAMQAVRDNIRRVARVPFPVLIEGESGAGKELVARAIHRLSNRAGKPFRALNCAAMAEDLVEAELFGHAQGAFTGASSARPGLFEDADRGTLFLDEASELSPRAQAKLLRVLQEGEVRRVGETTARRVDVRIIAATNRPIREAVAARAFRADLSFRLDVLRVDVPPLRQRPEDIPVLCAHFWADVSARTGTSAVLSADALGRLAAHDWPGNVRELQNVIAALAVSAPRRGRVTSAHLPPHVGGGGATALTLHQARAALERDLVTRALARSGGRQARAAAELGVTRQGLAKLMRRLGLPAA